MKKLFYLFSIAFVATAFTVVTVKDYVVVSGKITNPNSDFLTIQSRSFSKKIQIQQDGTFSDTLKVAAGYYQLSDGTESLDLYLKNGFELDLVLDTKEFDASLVFKGIGAEANNYLASKNLFLNTFFAEDSIFVLDKVNFDKKVNEGSQILRSSLAGTKKLDPIFIENEKKEVNEIVSYYSDSYNDSHFIKTVLVKGAKSPKFIAYENYSGGKTSLEDLKGKYVYIDVWATWCDPCKGEIPFLKEIEKSYHSKNIAFVSISVDELKDYEKWKQIVKEKELSGVQLFSDANWSSQFVKDYRINGIPRFILVDPLGNIVTADAPRPSSKELKVLLGELVK